MPQIPVSPALKLLALRLNVPVPTVPDGLDGWSPYDLPTLQTLFCAALHSAALGRLAKVYTLCGFVDDESAAFSTWVKEFPMVQNPHADSGFPDLIERILSRAKAMIETHMSNPGKAVPAESSRDLAGLTVLNSFGTIAANLEQCRDWFNEGLAGNAESVARLFVHLPKLQNQVDVLNKTTRDYFVLDLMLQTAKKNEGK